MLVVHGRNRHASAGEASGAWLLACLLALNCCIWVVADRLQPPEADCSSIALVAVDKVWMLRIYR